MDEIEIASKYGSPAYIYDLAVIRQAYRLLKEALPEPCRIYYSLKANPHPIIVSHLIEQGCGCEVSSRGELTTALASKKCDPQEVLYTGPGKTRRDIQHALKRGVTYFSVESLHDMKKIIDQASVLSRKVELVLRINPELNITGSGLTMGGTASQFGIDASAVIENLAAYRSVPWATIVGYHIYMATNVRSTEKLLQAFLTGIQAAAKLCRLQNITPALLDLGGGFGHDFAKPGAIPDFRALREPLQGALDTYFPAWRQGMPHVAFEAGRYLTAACGSLICTVVDVKRSKNEAFVVLDAGINHLGGMAGLNRVPRIGLECTSQERTAQKDKLENAHIVGPLCTPLDYLARGVDIPKVQPGDVLRIPNVGAYGLTASLLGFLSREAPVEIIVDGSTFCHFSKLELQRKTQGGYIC